MRRVITILLVLGLAGCTASFQPFPGAGKAELAQTDANVQALAQAINQLAAKIKELEAKKAVK